MDRLLQCGIGMYVKCYKGLTNITLDDTLAFKIYIDTFLGNTHILFAGKVGQCDKIKHKFCLP